VYELGASGNPRQCAGAGNGIQWQHGSKAAIVEERDQFGVLSVFPPSSFLLDAVLYKCPEHPFYHLRITVNWTWSFLVCRIRMTIMGFVSFLFV
jgi:hypothetical protein